MDADSGRPTCSVSIRYWLGFLGLDGSMRAGLLFNNSEIRSRICCFLNVASSRRVLSGCRKCGYMLIAKAIGKLKMRLGATSFMLVEVNVTSSM